MKTRIYIISLSFLLALQPSVTTAMQKDGPKKVIKKEFSVLPDAQLKLANSFGNVTCTLWDKNEISIEVTISVDTKSEEAAEKIFSRIEISSEGTESSVQVSTQLSKSLRSHDHFSIDYQVMMPPSVSVDITNKFGDVMIAELNAKSAIKVEYGKASLGKLNFGDNLLDISFGSASVKSIKGAVVKLQFSKIRMDYAGSLRIDSKYSDMEAGEVIVMEGKFEGGDIQIGQASVLTLDVRFSNVSIGSVKQKINLDTQFGSFEVGMVSPDLKSLVVENQHGSVEVGLPDSFSYSLDAESHFGSIEFPKDHASFTTSTTSSQDELYRGTVGTTPTANVKIRNEFGSIKLNQ